jgi:PAS domain S-box-containing protein
MSLERPSKAKEPTVNHFQTFLDASLDAIAEYDRSSYVFINKAGANLVGLAPAEMIGKTNRQLAEQAELTSVRDVALQLEVCIQQVLRTAEPLAIVHIVASGGKQRCYETVYTPILDQAGTVERIFSVGRDVTLYCWTMPFAKCHGSQPEQANNLTESVSRRPIIGAAMPGLDGSLPASHQFQDLEVVPLHAVEDESVSNLSGKLDADTSRLEAERQRAALIRQSTEFLQLVLDNIPQYIFWKDRNSVYLGCNRRWATMAGIGEPEHVIGVSDYDLPWASEEIAWYLACDRQVMETDTPMLRIKQSQLQADGRKTWREVNKLPLHDANGNVVGMLGTIEDITDRKLAEDMLRQSEAKFRELAQREELLNRVSNQIRHSLDLNTILQTVVREIRQLLNTDRVVMYQFDADWHGIVVVEDVIEPWMSVLGEIGADDCFPDQFATLYQQGRIRAIDNIFTANLDQCHVDFLAQLQVQANLIVPIIWSGQSTTAKAEIDPVSPQAAARSGLWGLLIVHECRSPRVWQEAEIDLLSYLANQVAIAIQQAELYIQATENATTAQLQAQQLEQALLDLQQTQAQLIQTEKMSSLGQLVAGVAHEINNPVNFIYGNVNPIREYTEDLIRLVMLYQQHYPNPVPEIKTEVEAIELDFLINDLSKVLDSVKIGADRIRQIVLSLRTFSRVDEAEMKHVDIHEGIDSTLLILQHRLKPKLNGTSIQVIKQYGTLPVIECYPSQLNQVFMNILSNAIDALEQQMETRESGLNEQPTITICTELISPDRLLRGDQNCDRGANSSALPSPSAVVRIHNNGSAISPDVQARLFDPFFTTKPVGKGTGLGLSISYQIVVEKHNGILKCLSKPGQGVEFWIQVPIAQL